MINDWNVKHITHRRDSQFETRTFSDCKHSTSLVERVHAKNNSILLTSATKHTTYEKAITKLYVFQHSRSKQCAMCIRENARVFKSQAATLSEGMFYVTSNTVYNSLFISL
jgi:hypothetical protein